jgi:pseudouridine kinase
MGEAGAALLTRGAGGGTTAVHLPALPTAVVSVSGAGDCLTAGFAAAKLRGCSDPAALAAGVVAATAAVSSPANVPSELSFPQLERQAARLARRAEVLQLPALTAKL